MSRMIRAAAAVALAAVCALALGGCWVFTASSRTPKAAVVTTDTAAATTTALPANEPTTVPVDPAKSTAIYHPINGSAVRKALLDSARTKMGTGSSFYVNQLWAQGDKVAVGDLTETSGQGRRVFVVWVGPPWKAVWFTAVGDGASTQQRAMHAVPQLTSALATRMDWGVVKQVDKSGIQSSLSSAVKQWTGQVMSNKGKPYTVTLVKVAPGTNGVWWGRAVVQPTGDATNQYESIEYWAKWKNNAWTGRAQDPEPPAPTTYFPSSVVGTLFP